MAKVVVEKPPVLMTIPAAMKELNVSRYKIEKCIDRKNLVPVRIENKTYFLADEVRLLSEPQRTLASKFEKIMATARELEELTQDISELRGKIGDLFGY